jgi:hypothetical protein
VSTAGKFRSTYRHLGVLQQHPAAPVLCATRVIISAVLIFYVLRSHFTMSSSSYENERPVRASARPSAAVSTSMQLLLEFV